MDPTSCFFPQNLVAIANIKTPMFLLNAAYDAWQKQNFGIVWKGQEILIPLSADPNGLWHDCKMDHAHCNSSQMQFLQDFKNQMLNAMNGFSKSNKNCFIHKFLFCLLAAREIGYNTWYEND
ncbi:hypothetical protein V6N11_077695 [Hibiscus sabdariffa]|uniref:Pectin acetylesterase n=1 Tax=Hibiscus sabdariffa TaxID=183260 RepID=A0ABR2TE66_9ROSI